MRKLKLECVKGLDRKLIKDEPGLKLRTLSLKALSHFGQRTQPQVPL